MFKHIHWSISSTLSFKKGIRIITIIFNQQLEFENRPNFANCIKIPTRVQIGKTCQSSKNNEQLWKFNLMRCDRLKVIDENVWFLGVFSKNRLFLDILPLKKTVIELSEYSQVWS